MQSLQAHIQSIVQAALKAEFPDNTTIAEVEYCDIEFGHFASNIAMSSSKAIGKNPMEIAKQLAVRIDQHPSIASVEVLKPGFINVRLTNSVLIKQLGYIHQDLPGYIGNFGKGKKMIIDYSHPNIGKPMGVHHLLSTIIGDSIKRTYRQVGCEVIADNFIGDMGTQFGRLIYAVKNWGDMQAIEANPVPELLKLYVRFHIAEDSDDSLDEAGRLEYKKLEKGDPQNRELLGKIQAWSMAEVLEIYKKLNIEFDYFNGESFYEDKIDEIVDLGIKKNLFKPSQGALVCELDNPDEPPALIKKSDGTSLYLTRDLARVMYWQQQWSPDLMVNVVDVAQSLQLKQVYEVADKLGLTQAKNIHVPFGRMTFKDESMSTRKGNIILVEDLIDTTKKKVTDQIVALSKDLNTTEQANLSEIISINVIKYTILHQNRLSNLTFDWNNVLSIDGDSAPYLAYSAVRMQSVRHKASQNNPGGSIDTAKVNPDVDETELILALSKINQVYSRAISDFEPSQIAHYCYELCRQYNSFYHAHQIIGDNGVDEFRLLLNNAVFQAVSLCFDAMGMEMPQKMWVCWAVPHKYLLIRYFLDCIVWCKKYIFTIIIIYKAGKWWCSIYNYLFFVLRASFNEN